MRISITSSGSKRRGRPAPGPKARSWAKLGRKRRRPQAPPSQATAAGDGTGTGDGAVGVDRPSVREVYLLGLMHQGSDCSNSPSIATPSPTCPESPSRPPWEPGERLTWSGRVYRVEATQTRTESPPQRHATGGRDEAPGYVYLTPVSVQVSVPFPMLEGV
jgi:hypothetical protein